MTNNHPNRSRSSIRLVSVTYDISRPSWSIGSYTLTSVRTQPDPDAPEPHLRTATGKLAQTTSSIFGAAVVNNLTTYVGSFNTDRDAVRAILAYLGQLRTAAAILSGPDGWSFSKTPGKGRVYSRGANGDEWFHAGIR